MLLTAAAALVVLPVPSLLSTAQAAASQTITVPVNEASWFWRGQVGVIGNTGIAAPVAISDPTVPGGDLAVSGPELPAVAGSPAGPLAETYLSFDVGAIPVGSTITSFKISLPVDSRGVTADALGAAIVACAPRSSWSGGLSAAPYAGKPADGCDSHSPRLTPGADGHSYQGDIASVAQEWVAQGALNLGVAITDDPGNSTTAYQVVFGPRASLEKLTASVTFTPLGPSHPGPIVAGPGTPPSASASTGDGATAVTAPGLVSVVPVGPLPTALPPNVAIETGPLQPVAPVVASALQPAGPSAPPLGFWFALIMIVLLLGTTSLVLADPNVSVRLIADRGVARALRARRSTPSQLLESR